MTLQEQLAADDMAKFIRDDTDEHLSVFTKSTGDGYWLVIEKGSGRNKQKTNIDCASFADLVAKLAPGEAESDEWFTL